MIPYKADVMMRRWPWANWVIIAVTVVIGVLDMWVLEDGVSVHGMLWSANTKEFASEIIEGIEEDVEATAEEKAEMTQYIEGLGFRPYQVITYAFLHDGFWHLFGNMLFLFVFGNAICAKIGDVAYSCLYLALAAISGVAWYMFPGEGVMLVGASGGVMGIAGMFLVMYPLNEISIFTTFMWRVIIFHLSAVWVLLGYFALDMLGFFSGGSDVAHISHLTGMAAGAGVMAALILTSLVKPGRGERTLPEVLRIKVKREDPPRKASTIRTTPYNVKPPSVGTAGVAGATGLKVVRRAQTDELPAIELEGPVVRDRGELPPIEFGAWETTVEKEEAEQGPIDLSFFEDEEGKA